MAEESFPVVEQPMTAEQWRSVTLGIGSGVLDEGGAPYRLVGVSNANNTVTVAVDSTTGYAHAILRGFYHKTDKNVTLSVPAVTSKTTYYLALQYDPNRSAPVVLDVFTSLDRSGGKDYHVLHTIVREPNQLLTDATATKTDMKVAPSLTVDEYMSLPPAESVLWGTTCIVNLPHEVLYQSRGSTGSRGWRKLAEYNTVPADELYDWTDKTSTTSYISPTAGGYTRSIGRRGKSRKLRGRVALASENDFMAGNRYRPWSGLLDPEDRPLRAISFTTSIAGATTIGFARVEIDTDGEIYVWVSRTSPWISFDGIEWEVA